MGYNRQIKNEKNIMCNLFINDVGGIGQCGNG